MNYIKDILAAQRRRVTEAKDRLAYLREHQGVFNGMAAIAHAITQPDTCPKGVAPWEFSPDVELEIEPDYWESGILRAKANVCVSSFKHDERLLGIFDRAKSAGMEYQGHVEEARWEQVRYDYKSGNLRLMIVARLKEGSTACRRVEVGRKIVEREEVEYKLICD